MIYSDYIMRMIEQMTGVLAKVLFNKKRENPDEALLNIDNAFCSMVGLDAEMIGRLSAADIISLLSLSGDAQLTGINCIIIAKLVKEKTDIHKSLSMNESQILIGYQKALVLYIEGITNLKNEDVDKESWNRDVKDIIGYLGDNLTADMEKKVAEYRLSFGE